MKRKIWLIMLLCLPMIKVKALCENTDYLYLKDLTNRITINYELYEDNGTKKFKLIFSGMTNAILVRNKDTGLTYEFNANIDNLGIMTLYNFYPESVNSFEFLSKDYTRDCYYDIIDSRVVTLPYYNHYSEYEVCKDIPEAYLCLKTTKTNLTESMFLDEINKYIDGLKNKPTNNDQNNIDLSPNYMDQIVSFMLNYYVYILVFIIVIGTGGIIIIKIRQRGKLL